MFNVHGRVDGRHPTHGAGKASELRLLVSFVKQRLHSSSLLKGNGWSERGNVRQKVGKLHESTITATRTTLNNTMFTEYVIQKPMF